jgi:ABC-type multidrug transport system fused ATPase/permease subunit
MGVAMLLASNWGNGQVLLAMLEFFVFVIWIWLLIVVFSDIFRSHDLSGVAKTLWTIFVIVIPYLGVFIYLVARGGKMQEHAIAAAKAQEEARQAYIQQAAGTGSPGEELTRLADLKDKGVIDDAEFEKLKAKAIGN